MAAAHKDLPEHVEALKAALVAERDKRIDEAVRAARAEAELAVAKAKASDDAALIAHQRVQIEKLTRQLYGQHSERTVRPARTRSLRSTPSPRPRRWWPSLASDRHASPFPRICRASAWSCRAQPLAYAAAVRGYANWVRTSPRRWR